MHRYLPEEFLAFLRAADRELDSKNRLLIIGGAAAALAYGVAKASTDIDTIGQLPESLKSAFDRAADITGTSIPVTPVGVWDAPHDYKSRLVTLGELGLHNLEIVVPERHDLALMKTVRGYENDFQAIAEMHEQEPLSGEILLDRYLNEMWHVIGRHEVIDLNFVLLIQMLFGEAEQQKAQAAIDNKRANSLR